MKRIVLALVLVAGCSNTEKQKQAVIDEGVALVRGWEPDGPLRAAAKAQFLADAAAVSPAPSPSPSPAPGAK